MRFVKYLLLALFLWLPIAPVALAAESAGQPGTSAQPAPTKIDRRKLIVPPRNPDGSMIMTPFLEDPKQWVLEQQRVFYGAMSGAMRGIKSETSLAAAMTLILLSFGYGVFHAVGPGHGKAVISTWLVATENELKRGILVAFMSAGVQALTAIAIVSLLLLIVSAVGTASRTVTGVLTSSSFALIAGMGLWLVWSALRPFRRSGQVLPSRSHDHHAADDHHGHDHQENCDCHHAHLPAAREVKGEWSWTKASSLAVAVGIRPCTGAVLALIFANTIGLYWAGVASTVVMALGTAITVSCIAALAVYSKRLALRMATSERAWLDRLAFGLKLGGGLAIAAFGGFLFWMSLWTTQIAM